MIIVARPICIVRYFLLDPLTGTETDYLEFNPLNCCHLLFPRYCLLSRH
jgi:hypothetical protein